MARTDPYANFNFRLEIGGTSRAYFKEASGLDSSIEVIQYREGGDNVTARKLPGLTTYSNIVLKRGVTDDPDLQTWHKQWITGDPARKRINGSIVLRDLQGQDKVHWEITNAWPAKWSGPSFNAEGKEVAIETLELCHEGIERK
jgi:phage tail-like protein